MNAWEILEGPFWSATMQTRPYYWWLLYASPITRGIGHRTPRIHIKNWGLGIYVQAMYRPKDAFPIRGRISSRTSDPSYWYAALLGTIRLSKSTGPHLGSWDFGIWT